MDLKERFEEMNVTPDEGVWNDVMGTLKHRRTVRRAAWIAAAALVVAAGVALGVSLRGNEEGQTLASLEPVEARPEASSLSASNDAAPQAAVAPQTTASVEQKAQAHSSDPVTTAESVASADQSLPVASPAANVATTPKMQSASKPAAPAVKTAATAKPTETTVVSSPASGNVAENTNVTPQPTAGEPKVSPVTEPEELCIWIPNAISLSDANDANRHFSVIAEDESRVSSFRMYIYNRAGQMVFKSTDIHQAWNGTLNGRTLPMGAYVYTIEYYDNQLGKLQSTRGTVTLVR